MANKNTNMISSSKRAIYSKLLDIASNYLEENNEDYLKTGLFGYITESMAMMMRDSTIHKGMLYNESFLNTAIMPKSVYNWAKMFNIEISDAKPAYADIEITIPKSIILSLSAEPNNDEKTRYGLINEDNQRSIFINKEDSIVAGDYYFSLEHSIRLITDEDGGITAEYVLSEYTSTDYQGISYTKYGSKYPLMLRNIDNNVVITARAYQYRLQKYKRQIASSSFLNKVQRFKFEDQFAGAKLFYSTFSEKNVEINLLYSNFARTASMDKFALYNLSDANQFELIFRSGEDGFIPATNSTLDLYIYTTKGSNIPNKFSGDATMRMSNERLRTLPVIINFNPVDIIGGKNAPSLEDIKKTIINEISSRNSIITESDLNNYFSILVELIETINGGRVTFKKKRDDILKRVFSTYILLRDGNNISGMSTNGAYTSMCVPTNTIKGVLEVQPGLTYNQAKFRLDPVNNVYTSLTTNTSTTEYYMCPFLMYVNLSPFKKVKYIYNMTNDESELIFSRQNQKHPEFIPENISIYRGFGETGEVSKSYTVTFSLKSTAENTTIPSNDQINILFNGTTVDGTSVAEIEEIANDDGTVSYVYTYSIEVGDSEFTFETNDNSETNYGTTISIKTNKNNGTATFKEDIKIGIDIYNDSDKNNLNYKLESSSTLSLFKNLDDIMLSDVGVTIQDTTVQSITVTDIPVIHSSFFNVSDDDTAKKSYEERSAFLTKQLFTYINLLRENLGKLETSTFFDMKFYNTYGISNLYHTTTSDLSIEMIITLTSSYKNNNALKNEIRDYIRRLVDKSNENENLKMSNIISLLTREETYGNYIHHIEFVGINGTLNQYVYRNDKDDTNLAPEWLNISYESAENIRFE